MKKLFMTLLVLLMLGCPALAEEADWYLDKAQELAVKVGVLAKDESYFQMMTGQSFDCAELLKTADFEKMVSAYRCTLPDEAGVRVILRLVSGGEMSDAALDWQIRSLPETVLTMYAGKRGADELAVASMLTYSRTYIAPENFEQCVYVLELDGAIVGVSFSRTGDETVTVSARPMFVDENEGIADALDSLTAFGGIPVLIEQIY